MSLTKRNAEFLVYWMAHLGGRAQPRPTTSALLQVAVLGIVDLCHTRCFAELAVARCISCSKDMSQSFAAAFDPAHIPSGIASCLLVKLPYMEALA